jgi:glycosyltransferase involved in cell wall biosynthesis
MISEKFISVVIPNYNNAATIGKCLEAAFLSIYTNFEVIVVDDNSNDNSVEIIKRFPCRLLEFREHRGASCARNTGAFSSRGDFIFLTDSDCLLNKDTLSIINKTLSITEPDVIIGGTYTKTPYDKGFFNLFQSLFVYYSETKRADKPDYIAAHAMVMSTQIFRKQNGFPEEFLPIIEDVEFTHRLRREGCKLVVNPQIQVRHIFNFSFNRSLINAVRKSMYWTMYSIGNRDLLTDSGSASTELKVNVISAFSSLLLLILWVFSERPSFLYPIPVIFILNLFVSRGLVKTFHETGGIIFAGLASIYYTLFYSLSVGTGTVAGMAKYFFGHRLTQTKRQTQRHKGTKWQREEKVAKGKFK